MKEGERMEHTFEKRKKVIYDLICDDLYVPMKLKEIAMLLQLYIFCCKFISHLLQFIVNTIGLLNSCFYKRNRISIVLN